MVEADQFRELAFPRLARALEDYALIRDVDRSGVCLATFLSRPNIFGPPVMPARTDYNMLTSSRLDLYSKSRY